MAKRRGLLIRIRLASKHISSTDEQELVPTVRFLP